MSETIARLNEALSGRRGETRPLVVERHATYFDGGSRMILLDGGAVRIGLRVPGSADRLAGAMTVLRAGFGTGPWIGYGSR